MFDMSVLLSSYRPELAFSLLTSVHVCVCVCVCVFADVEITDEEAEKIFTLQNAFDLIKTKKDVH